MSPYIGQGVRRFEDERLITGRGRYAGDIKLEGKLHLALSRSPVPHARIGRIDTSAARAMPGVVAVWTAADLPEVTPGLSDFVPTGIEQRGRPILNKEEVNYVGECYAVAVAETAYQARDAAAISNAVEDALRKRKPDVVVDPLPITPDPIVELLTAGR